MYGFINCCLEDMVLQQFGETVWRRILIEAGINLRGASFLMHQVYADETTFKLVAAASQVSGLLEEVLLEKFGEHFLVYCQKNGYDQILRVLGSNLYDFLTNLDNLHDHLASIYPGMRAPSFRVTRNLESNGGTGDGGVTLMAGAAAGATRITETENLNQEQQHAGGSHMSLAAGSMYLHYYSRRKRLSPIVRGLVLAVARKFFSMDIVMTECKLLRPQPNNAYSHVVFKIDCRPQANIQLAEQTNHVFNEATQEADAQQVKASSTGATSRRTPESEGEDKMHRQQQQDKTMASSAYGDTMSKLASDSLINSEIMMQTFPFHVIFDRHFNLVQVGNALLRVTSLYWQRRQQQQLRNAMSNKQSQQTGQSRTSPTMFKEDLVKFGDLFSIDRPKIEFTFDAIADHTNQVFVVKTRPQVLNADYLRSVVKESGLGAGGASSSGSSLRKASKFSGLSDATPQTRPSQSLCPMSRMAMKRRSCAPRLISETSSPAPPLSPLDGSESRDDEAANGYDTQNKATTKRSSADGAHQHHHQHQHQHGAENDSGNELSSFNPLSLRLKGQMIILGGLGPIGGDGDGGGTSTSAGAGGRRCDPADQINQAQPPGSGSGPTSGAGGVGGEQLENLPSGGLAQQGPFCLFLCSPRVDHLDQLMESGVKMSDLALHDRARELMLMSHTHKKDREAVKKLDQASNDLKKMDTKLRQENKRTNEVLHNIFPAKIATLLSHGTKIESESFDPVTCLYSDIIGFTKMCGSENVRPIDIVRLLNTIYLQFDNLTNIHGVYKVETIGDAYVIVGGLPEPLEDHADRCVRMGLDMVKVIATVRSPADNQPIQMRIGIHSGPVVAGIVGTQVPRYALFGNITMLANQLESHGVGGKIHISDVTLQSLTKRDKFIIEDNLEQVGNLPFKTYFVTNYLGDQTELLRHEKILKEQLIKDFELLGSEVELVDDSSSELIPVGAVTRQQQQQQPVSSKSFDELNLVDMTTTRRVMAGRPRRASATL